MQQAVQRWQGRRRYKRDSGFTIVELLIVIIVIAILAVIVITTYNGVQQRAANAKTIVAVESWVKALRLYNADTDAWPTTYNSCLGEGYPFGYNGDSPTNQCIYSATASTYIERASFVTAMRPYIGDGPLPTPDMQTVGDPGSNWNRGAAYINNASGGGLHVRYVLTGTTTCPAIGGTTAHSKVTVTGGVYCRANLAPSP